MHTKLPPDWEVLELSDIQIHKDITKLVADFVGSAKGRKETDEKAALVRSVLLNMLSKMFIYERDHTGMSGQEVWETYVRCFQMNLDLAMESAKAARDERLRQQEKGFS